jgi:lipoyl synthase
MKVTVDKVQSQRLPDWLVKPIPQGKNLIEVRRLLHQLRLHTVCESAECPNLGECFSKLTATFMIMGNVCTRNCRFCAVKGGITEPLESNEPDRIAKAAGHLGLSHVVVTSVTRDDLVDGGANHFAQTIVTLREANRTATVEVLVPDFQGSQEAIDEVVRAKTDIFNHNLETVPRLYEKVRPQANYQRSLELLKVVKEFDANILTKSGLMVGLGETNAEILRVMDDLRQVDCDFLTIGQYLRPSEDHVPVARFVSPKEFEELAAGGREKGFKGIAAAPFVRSSYRAGELYRQSKKS